MKQALPKLNFLVIIKKTYDENTLALMVTQKEIEKSKAP